MTVKNIPSAELDVLACLTHLERGTAREIREQIAPYRPMTHGAVVNLLKRLEAKSLVTKAKGNVGKAFVYQATQNAGPVYENVLSRLLHRVFGGNSLAMVASLFETKPPDQAQLEQLEALLSRLKTKRGRKERP